MATYKQEDLKTLFRDCRPKLAQISVNRASLEFRPRRFTHNHEHLEVVLFISGEGEYIHNARSYRVKPGTLAILNQGMFHAENYPAFDGLFINVGIQGVKLWNLPAGHLLPPDIEPVVPQADSFRDLLRLTRLLQLTAGKKSPYAKEEMPLLLQLFLLMLYETAVTAEHAHLEHSHLKSWTVGNAAKEYMEKNYSEEINIGDVAKEQHVSSTYLSHAFQKEFGYSPTRYLSYLRIGNAQTLLSETDLSITEISHMVGFNSSNNFYIAFHKVVGHSPSEYRKLLQEIHSIEEASLKLY